MLQKKSYTPRKLRKYFKFKELKFSMIRTIPAHNVIQEFACNKHLSPEWLHSSIRAIYGHFGHCTQGLWPTVHWENHLMVCHIHEAPQFWWFRSHQPGAAHKACAHQDLNGPKLHENCGKGIKWKLRPIPSWGHNQGAWLHIHCAEKHLRISDYQWSSNLREDYAQMRIHSW